MSKRFSATTPLKRSTTPSSKKHNSTSSQKQLQTDSYFCHFKNAMYMGGMKTFQRNGKGIMIHDQGASIITSYHHDMKHGHNIVFMENCIMSIEYIKNKVSECAIRVPNYLIYLNYNKEQQLDGKSILIDYQARTIYYLVFRKNTMIQKNMEKEYAVINRVFDLDNLEFLIGITHAKVFKHDIEKTQHIKSQKTNTKLNVGFYRNGLLHGLGFTLITKDTYVDPHSDTTRRGDSFFIKLAERGFFFNSQLTGMGEKWFKNGNQYIGDFKADVFQGRGLLKNSLKNNWVYGSFESGNLVDLIDYNNEGDTKKLKKIIESMHERKNSWINKQIELEDANFFLKEIDRILQDNPKNQIKSLEQRKQEVLRKIQDNFICSPPGEDPMSSSRNIYNYYNQTQTQRQDKLEDSSMKKSKKMKKQSDFDGKTSSPHYNYTPKRDSPPISSSPYHQSPQTKYQYFSDSNNFGTDQNISYSRRNNLREVEIQQKKEIQGSRPIMKLYEVPTTKQSSSRHQRNNGNLRQLSGQKLDAEMKRSRAGIFRNYAQYSPSRSKYSKVSAIQKEPEANLDSKRLIGRSRLFKYLGNQEQEEEPPTFNYQPINR